MVRDNKTYLCILQANLYIVLGDSSFTSLHRSICEINMTNFLLDKLFRKSDFRWPNIFLITLQGPISCWWRMVRGQRSDRK